MHLAASLRAVVVATACLAPALAHANPASAWAAAKAHLPGDAVVVAGANVGELGKSSLVKTALSLGASDVKKGIERVQRVCGLDLWTTIEAVAIATDGDFDDGVVFVAVKNLDQAKLGACIEALVRDGGDKDATLVATSHGAITELAVGGHKTFVRWVGADVLAVAVQYDDKARLERWTPKKGAFAKSRTAKLAAKANTKATVWGASAKATEMDGVKITGLYGAAILRGGNLDAAAQLVFESQAIAKLTADKLAAELASRPEAKALAGKIQVSAAKDEMVVKAKLTEGELMQAASVLMP